MNNPLISVIIPVYKVERYLDRCINSVVNQTYQNLEIILVDDGSPDNCPMLCDQWAFRDSRIKVIHKINEGLSSARNSGIDLCKGDYISFVDSDDWIEPDMLECLLHACEKHKTPIACAGRYDVDEITGKKKVGLCPSEEITISAEQMLGKIFTWDQCDSSACDKLFAASLFTYRRFPIGKRSEDVAIMYEIISGAGEVTLYPKPLYNYRQRQGSITKNTFSENVLHFSEHTEKILQYIQKYYPTVINQAYSFNIYAICYSMAMICKQPKHIRAEYRNEYKLLKRRLWIRREFWVKNSYVSNQRKIRCFLLLIPPFYRIADRIVHR